MSEVRWANGEQGEVTLRQGSHVAWRFSQCSLCGDVNNSSDQQQGKGIDYKTKTAASADCNPCIELRLHEQNQTPVKC